MYPISSQKKYWTFNNLIQLNELRQKQNQKFIETHGQEMDFTSSNGSLNCNGFAGRGICKFQNKKYRFICRRLFSISTKPTAISSFNYCYAENLFTFKEQQRLDYFLDASEERLLLKQYEIYLKDFCRRFEPMMPKCVVGTAFHYFKRFFLHNSAMDYHPKEILATVVYLACKVEEFNVSIGQFVSNIKGDRNKAMDIILSNELLLMQHLNYYLTIHNPYRPIEGFLIDIKTRSSMSSPERLRPHIDNFIEKTFFTDACLLYAPSQIALAAVLHAAGREQENLDSYVTDNLLNGAREKLPALIEAIRKIRLMVKQYEVPSRDKVKVIEKKLEKCRNQENNPDSEIYKERMRKMYCDDDLDVEDSSYHVADSSADMSVLNMSQ